MSKTTVVQMNVAYRAAYRNRKDPKVHAVWAYETFPVSIREVDAAGAPVSYSLPSKAGPITWRDVDGTLMRPMLGDEGEPCGPEALSHHSDQPARNYPWFVSNFHRDHPESLPAHAIPKGLSDLKRTKRRALIENGAADHVPAEFWKWTIDERESAEVRAHRRAAEDMVIIDGILYRKALPPLIRVGLMSGSPNERAISISPYVPEDFNTHEGSVSTWGYAFFALEDLEMAEAFARHLLEESARGEWPEYHHIEVDPSLPGARALVATKEEDLMAGTVSILAFGLHRRNFRSEDPIASLTAYTLLQSASRPAAAGQPATSPEEAYSLFLRFANEHHVDDSHQRLARILTAADTFREQMRLKDDLSGIRF